MIEIPRSLARQLWAVLRRCWPKPHGRHIPRIDFQVDTEGLIARVAQPEIAVEYRQAGTFGSKSVSLPLGALADFEGRGPDTVTLEAGKGDKVVARWQDGSVPQVKDYDVGDCIPSEDVPDLPDKFVRNPLELLTALDEASQTTAGDGVRFALHRLMLRGRYGEVIATNGKELLIQGGFHFPWSDDVLIPRVPAFGCKELGQEAHVEIGKSKNQVVLRVGPWTFCLHIDTDARFPNVEQVIPKLNNGTTRWRIAPEDADFLAGALPRLPSADDDTMPVTVDLNGEVCLRACAPDKKRITEVVLARSSFTGKPMRFCLNRNYLGRVLQLGFEEVHVVNADTPFVAQDNQRTYVVMPLPKNLVLAPSDDALRIVSAEVARPSSQPSPERKKSAMPSRSNNGNGHEVREQKSASSSAENGKVSVGSLFAEAQTLRDLLRDAYGRANGLMRAIKRHRQQSKLVATTLASLRQLQKIDS